MACWTSGASAGMLSAFNKVQRLLIKDDRHFIGDCWMKLADMGLRSVLVNWSCLYLSIMTYGIFFFFPLFRFSAAPDQQVEVVT